jgi:Tfp pilus assembly protein PilX
MNRIADNKRRQGTALIATLVLMIFLSLMIAVVIRGNLVQSKYLRFRRSQAAALSLAESGVAEALRAIALQSGRSEIEATLSAERGFRVKWREERTGTHVYVIRSVGTDDTLALVARRAVEVRAEARAGQPARILSWSLPAE